MKQRNPGPVDRAVRGFCLHSIRATAPSPTTRKSA